MGKSNYCIIFLSAFCLLNFMGCGILPKKDVTTTTILEPSLAFKFSDVPVPAGFKALPQDSYSFESSGVRVGVLKYQGKIDADRVVNFYKEQMPMYNWNLLNIIEYGQCLLSFERENEICVINLAPKGGGTIITVSLGPKSQALPKKSEKPIK